MKKVVFIFSAVFVTAICLKGQQTKISIPPSQDPNTQKGFVNITEIITGIGLSITDAPYSKFIAGLTAVNGIQINKYLIAGAGTGLHFYNEGFLLPLYFSCRFTYPLSSTKISPYINGDIGILLNFKDTTGKIWTLLNPLIGASYKIKSNMSANLGAGILTHMKPDKATDSFMIFKLGLIFLPKR